MNECLYKYRTNQLTFFLTYIQFSRLYFPINLLLISFSISIFFWKKKKKSNRKNGEIKIINFRQSCLSNIVDEKSITIRFSYVFNFQDLNLLFQMAHLDTLHDTINHLLSYTVLGLKKKERKNQI